MAVNAYLNLSPCGTRRSGHVARAKAGLKSRARWSLVLVGLIAGAGSALASEDLAKKSGCLACHAIDRKVIGPSYKSIAAKYKGDAGAEARLMEKLKKGGAGSWGEIFMPSMQTVPEGDLKILVKWILSMT
jgi:cytochrome c